MIYLPSHFLQIPHKPVLCQYWYLYHRGWINLTSDHLNTLSWRFVLRRCHAAVIYNCILCQQCIVEFSKLSMALTPVQHNVFLHIQFGKLLTFTVVQHASSKQPVHDVWTHFLINDIAVVMKVCSECFKLLKLRKCLFFFHIEILHHDLSVFQTFRQ